MYENEVSLGGCYHSGLAYALGYDANGELELDKELFTNYDTGLCGNAVAAMMDHRRKFDQSRDMKRFIVALKPVQILTGIHDGEDYKLEDNAGCDWCGTEDRIDNDKLCLDCIQDDTCDECLERSDSCCCCYEDYDDSPDHNPYCECGELEEDCTCKDICDRDDEFCTEYVADTFGKMNAFARARWLKSQRET